MSQTAEIEVKNLDHLGIVAGLIDELEIVSIINNKLGIDKREKISAGTVVKAILINGLGFVARPLYLFSQFFSDKGVEILLGEGVKKDYLNDDKIGRVMDELYKYGLNNIFIEEVSVNYGGVEQIWLVVESEKRQKSDLEKLEKKLNQEQAKVEKILSQLQKEEFEHPQSAKYKLKGINKKLNFSEIAEEKIFESQSLVYNLVQRELRNNLKRAKKGVKNQVGKLTTSPTLRWIFQCFQGIHVLTLKAAKQIINLTNDQRNLKNYKVKCGM